MHRLQVVDDAMPAKATSCLCVDFRRGSINCEVTKLFVSQSASFLSRNSQSIKSTRLLRTGKNHQSGKKDLHSEVTVAVFVKRSVQETGSEASNTKCRQIVAGDNRGARKE